MACALAVGVLVNVGSTPPALAASPIVSAATSSGDDLTLPEPPTGQLSPYDALSYTSASSGTSPCLAEGITLALFNELGCRATSLAAPSVTGEPIPSNLVPETVVSSLTPNCSATPDHTPQVQLQHGTWVGATSVVATATSTMSQVSYGSITTFTSHAAPEGVGKSVSEAYSYANAEGESLTKEISSQLAKTYTFNVVNATPIPPYSFLYYTFKPSYTRHDVLWTWDRPGPSSRYIPLQDSYIDSVVTVDVGPSGTLRGKTEPIVVPMTPAEIRACQLGRTSTDAPVLRDYILAGPSNVGKLSQFPFYYLNTSRSVPVLRNIAGFTATGDYFGSGDGALVAQKPRIQTGWSADLDNLPLGQRSYPVSDSITMAAPTEVGFWLGGQCTQFTAKVGYNAIGASLAVPDKFSVYAAHPFEGKLIRDEKPLKTVTLPEAPRGTDLDAKRFAIDLNVPIDKGTKVLVLVAERGDGVVADPAVATTRNQYGSMVSAPIDILGAPSRIVVANPEVTCTNSIPVAGADHLVRFNTNEIVPAEVNLAPTQEQAVTNSKYFGVPHLDYNYYDKYNPNSACESHRLDKNAAGHSCSGGPIQYRGQVFTNGIGLHAPIESVRWSNRDGGVDPYMASCSAFSFKIAYAYYPAQYRPDHDVTVKIDGKVVHSFLLPANAQGALTEHKYYFVDYGPGEAPHSIELQVKNADPSSTINYDSHVNIIEPKLICRDQRASFETTPAPKSAPGDDSPEAALETVITNLSDAEWTGEYNGWGPIERDLTVGDAARGDGTPIVIGGQLHTKGIGMHADGALTVSLGGRCTTFTSVVGLSDNVADRGSVRFQVLADGAVVADSDVLRGSGPGMTLTADVTGVNALTLRVTNGGDNIHWDHGAWGTPTVTCAAESSPAPPAPAQPTPATETRYMSDLPFRAEQNGYGPIERDTNIGGLAAGDGTGRVAIGGSPYAKGLGMHSNGSVTIDLGSTCSSFVSDVGIDDSAGTEGSVTFRVLGDGALLVDSGVLRGTDAALPLSVDVTGVSQLTLEVTNAGDNWNWDHASWGGARLTCAQ